MKIELISYIFVTNQVFVRRSMFKIVPPVKVASNVVINRSCTLRVSEKEPEKAALVTTPKQNL